MSNFLFQLFSKIGALASMQFLVTFSPGPDITLIIKNSIIYSKKHAFFTILGIISGQSIHIVYNLLGLNFLKQNTKIFNYIGLAGGLYILYIGIQSLIKGYKLLRSKIISTDPSFSNTELVKNRSYFSVYKMGFFTNVLNPKAILFYLCVFSSLIDFNTSFFIIIFLGLFSVIFSLFCFSSIALLFSYSKIRSLFNFNIHWIEIVSGILFIIISLLLIFNSLKKF